MLPWMLDQAMYHTALRQDRLSTKLLLRQPMAHLAVQQQGIPMPTHMRVVLQQLWMCWRMCQALTSQLIGFPLMRCEYSESCTTKPDKEKTSKSKFLHKQHSA